VLHPDLRLGGEADRAALRAAEAVRHRPFPPPNHPVQTRALHACLRWRNANARRRDVLAAEGKERARIRSERGIRWAGRPLKTAA
jgi:hypothetical protein